MVVPQAQRDAVVDELVAFLTPLFALEGKRDTAAEIRVRAAKIEKTIHGKTGHDAAEYRAKLDAKMDQLRTVRIAALKREHQPDLAVGEPLRHHLLGEWELSLARARTAHDSQPQSITR